MADYDPVEFQPVLVPHFPVAVFTPSSPCPHNGRYRRGSSLCCMACHRSGRDYLPIFRYVPEPAIPKPPDPDEPDPFIKVWSEIIWERFTAYSQPSEAAAKPNPEPKLPKETRKERRRRLFGDIVKTLATGPPPAA